MPRHIMIDIETWDTASTAVIRAIALVGFSLDDTPQAMHLIDCRRTMDEQIQAGRTLCADTVRWWADQPHGLGHLLEQTGQVAGGVLSREPATLDELLDDLHAVAGGADEHEETRIWSRGHFDVAILEDLFTRALRPVPWRHSHVRDVRTLDEILPPTRAPLAHHPVADCLAQITHVCAALRLVATGTGVTTPLSQMETT